MGRKRSRPDSQKTKAKAKAVSPDPKGVITPETGGGDIADWLHKIAHPRQREFLIAYRETGTILQASKQTGIGRRCHYDWMDTSPEYRFAFKRSRDTNCSRIEDSLVDRLVNGWQEEAYGKGGFVGYKQKYDNSTALAYLDRHDEDFRTARKDLAGKVNITANIQNNLTQMQLSPDERKAWAQSVLEQSDQHAD